MKELAKITVCALVAGIFLVGCSYQRKSYLKRTDLPEYIYNIPLKNDFIGSNVGIFNFREPPYAKGRGRIAAESLYHTLLINKVFASVLHESDISDLRQENLLEIAHNKGYDLIITGDILYFFEGSLHHPSRIDQRIKVIDAKEKTTLWYAKAVDIGHHAPYTDYYVVEGRGAPAPTTRTLFGRNAQKFCKMLLDQPPQAFLATVENTQEYGPPGSRPQTGTGDLQLYMDEPRE